MIYYCCALAFEARPLIEHYGMKRKNVPGRFQFFVSENQRPAATAASKQPRPAAVVVISGTGSYAASVAATMLFSLYPPEQEDIFINFGICGALPVSGLTRSSVAIAYSVSCEGQHRMLYPDMMMQSDFAPVRLRTFSAPVYAARTESEFDIADMEGYGALHAALAFFECHRCFVIKTVSDLIGTEEQHADTAAAAMAAAAGAKKVIAFAEKAQAEAAKLTQRIPELPEAEQRLAEELCILLSLSFAQREQLSCLLRRRMLLGFSSETLIKDFIREELSGEEQKRDRRDGKVLFEKFKGFEKNYD